MEVMPVKIESLISLSENLDAGPIGVRNGP
jgi:hypothetical protein